MTKLQDELEVWGRKVPAAEAKTSGEIGLLHGQLSGRLLYAIEKSATNIPHNRHKAALDAAAFVRDASTLLHDLTAAWIAARDRENG